VSARASPNVFSVRFEIAAPDSGWKILAQTVNPFVNDWRARQTR
jgi:hypothetical protein